MSQIATSPSLPLVMTLVAALGLSAGNPAQAQQEGNYGYSTTGHSVPLPPSIVWRSQLKPISLDTATPDEWSTPKLTDTQRVIVVDETSGKVLHERNADDRFAPASIAKLITLSLLFDEIKAGRVSLDDKFLVSESAWRRGGASSGSSTMFAKPDSRVPVRDLIFGVAVQSGNDAAIAIAENLAGSEEQFARAMNLQARLFGMEDSYFTNATGWPDNKSYVTARDIATLARAMRQRYPDFMSVFSTTEFTWNGITQRNRNTLLSDPNSGVDGMKTGYVNASGYSIVVSAKRDNWRTVSVLSGMDSKQARNRETRKLVEWLYSTMTKYTAIKQGTDIGEIGVYGGETGNVGFKVAGDVNIIIPKWMTSAVSIKASVDTPLIAPVKEGEVIGKIEVTGLRGEVVIADLQASESIGEGGIMAKITTGFANALGWDQPEVHSNFNALPVTASTSTAAY